MDTHHQLSLPLTSGSNEPSIADAEGTPFRVPDRRKLPSEYSDGELLTSVLGPSTAVLCERLAASHDGFRTVGVLSPADLIEHGFTTGAVNRLSAVFEIAKRYGEREFKLGQPLRGSGDVYAHFRERLAVETCELFYAVLLDNKHRKLRDVMVSKGSLTASIVHPRDVFNQVVRHSAAAIVFVHNHPSGDPTPSKEDIEITRRLREVGELMGVRVPDHIVIGKGRYVSFVDDGYW
jgi:DNA repair protein RadC